MTDLLLIGGASPEMLERLGAAFTVHRLSDAADPVSWLAEHGAKIHYVATNGHDGVKPDYIKEQEKKERDLAKKRSQQSQQE